MAALPPPQNRPCGLSPQLGSSRPCGGLGLTADSRSAVGVYQVVCGLLAWRAEVHHGGDGLLADGLPDGGVPLLPLALVVRLVAGVKQQPPAEGAPAALAAQQVPGRGADRRAVALT